MDEERTAQAVEALKSGMERETALFTRLVADMDRLQDSFQARQWTQSLTIAQDFENAARDIEEADRARDATYESLKLSLGASAQAPFSSILFSVPADLRNGLAESWRNLRTSVFRLKMATGRVRYATQTMAEALNRILEGVFPHRRGKIYTRHGTSTPVVGSLLVDREM